MLQQVEHPIPLFAAGEFPMVEIEHLEKKTADGPAGPEGIAGIGGEELSVSAERAEAMLGIL